MRIIDRTELEFLALHQSLPETCVLLLEYEYQELKKRMKELEDRNDEQHKLICYLNSDTANNQLCNLSKSITAL